MVSLSSVAMAVWGLVVSGGGSEGGSGEGLGFWLMADMLLRFCGMVSCGTFLEGVVWDLY